MGVQEKNGRFGEHIACVHYMCVMLQRQGDKDLDLGILGMEREGGEERERKESL